MGSGNDGPDYINGILKRDELDPLPAYPNGIRPDLLEHPNLLFFPNLFPLFWDFRWIMPRYFVVPENIIG